MKQPHVLAKQRDYLRKYMRKKLEDPKFRKLQQQRTKRWIQKHKHENGYMERMREAQNKWTARQRLMNKYRLSENFYKDFFNFVKTDKVDIRNFTYLGNVRVRNIICYVYLDKKNLSSALQIINADTRKQSWKRFTPKESVELYYREAIPFQGWVYKFKPDKLKEMIRDGKLQ
jgi:hypothetical protein